MLIRRHFEVINRKFTTDEIRKFRVRESNTLLDTQRLWIYNPAIHGEDKDGFDREVERLNSGKIDDITKAEIAAQNPQKIAQGETINNNAYHVNDHVDRYGIKQGTQFYPIMTGWKLQEIRSSDKQFSISLIF